MTLLAGDYQDGGTDSLLGLPGTLSASMPNRFPQYPFPCSWPIRHLDRWSTAIWPGWEPPSKPPPSSESQSWVYPAAGLLAASSERHMTGPSTTGMWHSLARTQSMCCPMKEEPGALNCCGGLCVCEPAMIWDPCTGV